jgi:carbon-monoxide dehydrogenase large subunit
LTGRPHELGRKEDERFLRGRGQYVGDFRIPGAREVAFVRSSVAHGYLRSITIPEKHKGMVVTADDITSVNPIRATSSVSGLKHSREPILAAGNSAKSSPRASVARGPKRRTSHLRSDWNSKN